MKKNIFVFIVLLILSIPSVKSFFQPGAYTSHDLTHHIVRQIDMDRLLSEGQFPPRWSAELNNGYGYPLFIFNYPAPAVIGEVFYKLGLTYVDSVKAVMCLSMLASVIGMYLFLDVLLPNRKLASVLGALFYLYAPIRFINVYVAASVGASLAMGILPFIFWAILELWYGKTWAIIATPLIIALFITSHNVTALMFSPVILVFFLILLIRLMLIRSDKKIIFLKNALTVFFLGVGLSAFFWMPALLEKKNIVYDQIMANSWVDQFPTVKELIHSPWGYGLAHPGTGEPGSMSFQIGLAHILVMGILGAVIPFFKKKQDFLIWGIYSLTIFCISVFLMNSASSFLWKLLPLLYLIQYPYRFLAVSVFAASVSAALIAGYLPFKKIVFFVLAFLVIYANRNHLNINQRFDPGDEYFASLINDATSYNEHLPVWAYVPKTKTDEKISILEGEGIIEIIENKSAKVHAKITIEQNSILRFNQFYYPGWVLKDNGIKVPLSYINSGANSGMPVFVLDKGEHNFEAVFTETVDRKIADSVSIASFGFLVFLAFDNVRKNRKKVV